MQGNDLEYVEAELLPGKQVRRSGFGYHLGSVTFLSPLVREFAPQP
jgi:hypothetical protein